MTIEQHVDKTIGKRHRWTKPLGIASVAIVTVSIVVGVLMFSVMDPETQALAERARNPGMVVLDSAYAAVDRAQRLYVLTGSADAALTYGRALDQLTAASTADREALQKRLYHLLAIEAGKRYDIKWTYLYGLWVRESQVDPNAKGDGRKDHNGIFIPGTWKAFGLGQIHLATAQTHFDPKITKEQLLDPATNAMASAAVLHDYIADMGGSIRWGLSAYQQGPVAAKKQKAGGQQPRNMDYVADVLTNAAEAGAEFH